VITSNTAKYDGGGIWLCDHSSPTLTNCTITGNFDEDPMFCYRGGDTNYDGYFLKQENDGKGWPSSEWSPCIDAGDPGSDPFDGSSNTEYSTAVNGFLDTNRVDMGYHYKYYGCTYIELVSFEARPGDGSITLAWETGAEIECRLRAL